MKSFEETGGGGGSKHTGRKSGTEDLRSLDHVVLTVQIPLFFFTPSFTGALLMWQLSKHTLCSPAVFTHGTRPEPGLMSWQD